MSTEAQVEPLYSSKSAAGATLGRQLYQRLMQPALMLGVTPGGVEVAASAAQAIGCSFDVIVAAHIRIENLGIIGALAEDDEAVLDSGFQPRFGLMEALNEAIDRARRAVKTERLLFRGQRPLRSVEGLNVALVDANAASPWKLLAAVDAVQKLGAVSVLAAAATGTQHSKDTFQFRRVPLVCPAVVLDQAGHPHPFGDSQDSKAERLRSIVVARQAA